MLILFYKKTFNQFFSTFDLLQIDQIHNIVPKDVEIVFSDDKEIFNKADVVVIDLPFIHSIFNDSEEIVKSDKQIWVAWCLESEDNYPWIHADIFRDFFDLWMTYKQDADIVLPYYNDSYLKQLYMPPIPKSKDYCMFISSSVNHSGRLNYITELMKYIQIDSYGRWNNNILLSEDKGFSSKLAIIANYKFTVSFENAISKDYVTEKFFEPLIAGSVPIYLGAPNIDLFTPGENAFIDVRNYDSPQLLAEKLKEISDDNTLYNSFLKWKKEKMKAELQGLLNVQKIHPFNRLINWINRVR